MRKLDIQAPGEGLCLHRETVGRSHFDTRICFGIAYYEDIADVVRAEAVTRQQGNYYNGGWFHGMACGREKDRDFTDDEGTLWMAVTY